MKSILILVTLIPFLVACGDSEKSSKPRLSSSRSSLEIQTNYTSTSTTLKLSSLIHESTLDCGLQVGPGEVYDYEVRSGTIKLTDSRNTSITFKEKPGATSLLYILESSTDGRLKDAELEMPNSRTIRIKMECHQ